MPIEKQASLTDCNELFLRQALPLTYGNDDEKKAAKAAAKTAEADALAKLKEPKIIAEKVGNALLQRQFDDAKAAHEAETGFHALEQVVQQVQADAPVNDGLTDEQRAAVAAAKAMGV